VEKQRFLEYNGQTTPEILASSETHSHLSLLFAFEWGLQAKARGLGGEDKLNDEERLVLAVMSLDREVGNGGYHQFFFNSSRRFVPSIVWCLRRIKCHNAAAITERAIAAFGLTQIDVQAVEKAIARKDRARDSVFENCDDDFYRLTELVEKLFGFVVTEQDKIQLTRTDDYPQILPLREPSIAAKLSNSLWFWKRGWNPTSEEAQTVVRKIAQVRGLPATESDIEVAAVLYCFGKATRSGDLERGEVLVERAVELTRNEPVHQIEHKALVEALIEQKRTDKADQATLDYLRFLNACGPSCRSELGHRNSVLFWARLIKERRAELTRSTEFFESNFPELNLNEVKLLPRINIKPLKSKKAIQFLSDLPEYSSENGK
jgi:Domain of unknown function (DUF4375)